MVVVTIREENEHLQKFLQQNLNDSVLFAKTTSASFVGAHPDIVLLALQKNSSLTCDNAIFVVENQKFFPFSFHCKNIICIVDSSKPVAMEQVSRYHLRALTCGLSHSDTFTLSSFTQDSAVVSLQRQILTFDKKIIDPFEIPVQWTHPIDPFSLLATAAIFCLTGLHDSFIQTSVWKPNYFKNKKILSP